jgi:imidazolonepropionase-like amidohydrolase
MRFVRCLLITLVSVLPAAVAGPVILKASRMFDGDSDHLASRGLVVVVAGKIQGVGAGAPVPEGAEVIDLGDATLGIANRLGTLEAGKIAGVVAVPGDPTTGTHQTGKALFVMKDGVIYRNDRAKGGRASN